MRCALTALLTVFRKFDLPLNLLLVLPGVVIPPVADGALEPY